MLYSGSLFIIYFIYNAAKSLQSCPTLYNPIDGSPPGSPVPGILQARTLEWVAISFSNAWKWKVKVKSLSRVQLLATPWTAAYQAPPSMGFSRQEYWSGVPCPSSYTVWEAQKHCTAKTHWQNKQRESKPRFNYTVSNAFILLSSEQTWLNANIYNSTVFFITHLFQNSIRKVKVT